MADPQEENEPLIAEDAEMDDDDGMLHEAHGDQGYVFCLTPSEAIPFVLDYRTAGAGKIYRAATEKIEPLFDCTPRNLKGFLAQIETRSLQMNWDNVIRILILGPDEPVPEELDDQVRPSLLKDYGRITMDQVRQHADRYIGAVCRAAQNSHQLYVCLQNSLTKEARDKVLLNVHEYTVQGRPSGPLLLRMIIRDSHLDTNATTHIIRERLSSLDQHMVAVSSNIEQFNNHVKELLNSLHARGQHTQDLLANLFKAYKCASDRQFVNYIIQKQSTFDEGTDIDPSVLMQLALNKYNRAVELEEWNAPSTEELKIVALEAKLKTMIKAPHKTAPFNTPNKKNTKTVGKNKADKVKRTFAPRPADPWKLVPPKEGDPHTKSNNGVVWIWCTHHQKWAFHTSDGCDMNKKAIGGGSDKGSTTQVNKGGNKNSQALKISKALATIVESDAGR